MLPLVRKPALSFPELELEGFRVLVRPPAADDMDEWIRVRGENRDHLEPFEPSWPEDCLSPDFFSRRIRRQVREWTAGRAHAFLIFSKSEKTLIGGININNVCRGAAQFASLGYWIAADRQGEGYMSESLRLVIGYAFGTLKLARLNAGCIPENERSRRLLEKLGFREEGFAPSYIQINGARRDHVLYGLNADEWM